MKKTILALLAAVFLSVSCATTGDNVKKELRPTGMQTALGAVFVIGAMAGGAYIGASLADESGPGSLSYGVIGGLAASAAAGGIYWLLLELFGEKKEISGQEEPEKKDDLLLMPAAR